MKLNNIFTNEEIQLLNDNELEIVDKDYSYDEISFMKNTVDYLYNDKLCEQISDKLNKLMKQFDVDFDVDKWSKDTNIDAIILNDLLYSYDFLNKKVVSIKPLGNNTTANKYTMVNAYNNDDELSNQPEWDLMKKVTIDMIPDSFERARVFFSDRPISIIFEDGSSLEVLFEDYGVVSSSINNSNSYEYDYNLNMLFKMILNKKILDFCIGIMSEDDSDKHYMKDNVVNENNIKHIKLEFEDDLILYIGANGFVALKEKNENDERIPAVTMSELKKVYKHYDWLFWKEKEARNKNKKEIQLTEVEKDLINLLMCTNISRRNINAVMNTLEKEEDKVKMILYLCENKDKIKELSSHDLLSQSLVIKGILKEEDIEDI